MELRWVATDSHHSRPEPVALVLVAALEAVLVVLMVIRRKALLRVNSQEKVAVLATARSAVRSPSMVWV